MDKSESGNQNKLSRLQTTLIQRIKEIKTEFETKKLPFVSNF